MGISNFNLSLRIRLSACIHDHIDKKLRIGMNHCNFGEWNMLGVPLNYLFCEDEVSAELTILIQKLSENEKQALLESIKNLHDE